MRGDLIGDVWPPKGIETFDPWHLPLLNTLILLTSGTTVTWAHHALLEDDREGLKWGLICTIVLGADCSPACRPTNTATRRSTISGNIYGATFFMATGFHGAHVIIGTIFLIVCLLRAMAGHFTPKQHLGFEFAAWYWHFVDVVWLFLFVCIYVWGSGGRPCGWRALTPYDQAVRFARAERRKCSAFRLNFSHDHRVLVIGLIEAAYTRPGLCFHAPHLTRGAAPCLISTPS